MPKQVVFFDYFERMADKILEGARAMLDLLEDCGVHPPDVNRVIDLLGIKAHAASVEEADGF